MGFRVVLVWDLWLWDFGFRAYGLGLKVLGLGLMVLGLKVYLDPKEPTFSRTYIRKS